MKNQKYLSQYAELIKAEKYFPCVSIITSIQFQVNPNREFESHFKEIVHKTFVELSLRCTKDVTNVIIDKLNHLIENIEHKNENKSIAMFISPIFSKTYFLEIPIEDRIAVDNSFEIRDLIYSENISNKYYLIVLSSKRIKIYLGNTKSILLSYKIDANDLDFMNIDLPEKISNFTDAIKIKEILLDKFLLYLDKEIHELLQKYSLPIFIMGSKKIIGHYSNITHHKKSIACFIQGNYEEKTKFQLLELVTPYVEAWRITKNEEIFLKIEEAISHKRLSIGIHECWECAINKKGKHLVVEKNFVYPARQGSNNNEIFSEDLIVHNQIYMFDAVDNIIEMVVKSGGMIEFVDEGKLSKFGKIVLIQHY